MNQIPITTIIKTLIIFAYAVIALGQDRIMSRNKQECGPEARSLGQFRKSGAKWDWSDYVGVPYECRCEWFSSFGYDKGYISCWEKGCRGRNSRDFYAPGSKNDIGCTCEPGSDSFIASFFTLFHWECPWHNDKRKYKRPPKLPKSDTPRKCKIGKNSVGKERSFGEKWNLTDGDGNPNECTCETTWHTMGVYVTNCRIKGCYGKGKTFRAPGSKSAWGCTCIKGTSPALMDDYTLYHWKCKWDGKFRRPPTLHMSDTLKRKSDADYRPIKTAKMCKLEKESMGVQRKRGDSWDWMDDDGSPYRCSCEVPLLLRSQLIVACRIKGCRENRFTGKYYPPGSKNAWSCICTPGTEKMWDDYTLYHWECIASTTRPPPYTALRPKFKCPMTKETLGIARFLWDRWDWTDSYGRPNQCMCHADWMSGRMSGRETLYVHCLIEGCIGKNKVFNPPGSKNSLGCICAPGSGKRKWDDSRLYHWNCEDTKRRHTSPPFIEFNRRKEYAKSIATGKIHSSAAKDLLTCCLLYIFVANH